MHFSSSQLFMYLIACLRSYIKLLFARWKHCILFLWGWVFQSCMVLLFHVYPHQHLGFICIVYFIPFKQNSNLLSVFSDGHMGKKTLRWIYNILVPQGVRARSIGHFGAMWQLLVCVHSYRRICLIGPYYAGSLEIYLGNGLYVVLGVQSKILCLIVSHFSNA